MTDEKNTMCTIPWDLNRLSSFDFMKFTQAKEIGGGKQDLFMSLEGQKTWFRLACPSGGLVLNALRVTDAMAIYEARVFADANDRNPLASFTATQKADKSKGRRISAPPRTPRWMERWGLLGSALKFHCWPALWGFRQRRPSPAKRMAVNSLRKRLGPPLPRRRLTRLCRRPQAVLPRSRTKRPSSLNLPLTPLPVPPP